MNVIVLPGYFGFGGCVPGPGTNRSGVFFRDQAVALAKAGHEVVVLYVHFDSRGGTFITDESDGGARFVYIHAVPWLRFNSVQRTLLMMRYAKRAFPRGHADLIHAHVFTAVPQAWALSHALGVPYVVTEHSSSVRTGRLSRVWRHVAGAGYARANAVMAVSRPLAAAVAQLSKRKVQVLPNIARDEFFLAERELDNSRPFAFTSVGYGHPNKGWDLLLNAFSELVSNGHRAQLNLVGSMTDLVSEQIELLGLEGLVTVWGKIPPSQVRDVLIKSDCHVMSSRVETFGIASIEALATGLPIIMTSTDAADVIVNSRNGVVVPLEDPESLASAMVDMITMRQDFDSAAIREDARARFSGKALAHGLGEVYERVLRDGKRLFTEVSGSGV